MKISDSLSKRFDTDLMRGILETLVETGYLESTAEVESQRFLNRSVVPHLTALSQLFNRLDPDKAPATPESGLKNYWRTARNPKNFILGYVLGFLPGNAMRVAAAWSELTRLGYNGIGAAGKPVRAVELGAGPGSGAIGVGIAESLAERAKFTFDWTLFEQDKGISELGGELTRRMYADLGLSAEIASVHRKIAIDEFLQPKSAAPIDLFLSSYFMNELPFSPEDLADILLRRWDKELSEEALILLVEPALRVESRKLLAFRKAFLERIAKKKGEQYQVLLPCLGHQECDALKNPKDWCHEEATWWRPDLVRKLDQLSGLDRKTLPFSYLAIAKSKRARKDILPGAFAKYERVHRLVSPVHYEGKDSEFFVCGPDGKRRVRFRTDANIGRGSLLLDSDLRGEKEAGRVDRAKDIIE